MHVYVSRARGGSEGRKGGGAARTRRVVVMPMSLIGQWFETAIVCSFLIGSHYFLSALIGFQCTHLSRSHSGDSGDGRGHRDIVVIAVYEVDGMEEYHRSVLGWGRVSRMHGQYLLWGWCKGLDLGLTKFVYGWV